MNRPDTKKRLLCVAAASAALLQFAIPAGAQEGFPSQPIDVLVPWGPGGGASTISDLASRIGEQEGLSPVPMPLTHRPGASGLVGTALVAERKGDPHVFMPGGGALLAQVVLDESPVDPLKDLTPLALSAIDSSVIITRADSEFATFQDVLDKLREEPMSVTMGGAGGGPASWDGMLETVVSSLGGVEFNQIPFASGSEVQAAVLGGQVDIGTRQLSNAQSLLDSGEIRALAIMDAERNPQLPDVPTLRELGIDVVLNMSRGWFGPADLSEEEVAWYAEFFRKLSEEPRWVEYLEKSGLQNHYLGPDEWADFVTQGIGTIDELYTEIGLVE